MYTDRNGTPINAGSTIRIVLDKIDSLVIAGSEYRVYEGDGGELLIGVGVSLKEVTPEYCEVTDGSAR